MYRHRQKHNESRHGTSSTESVLGQRSRRLYCEKCQQAVDRRQAVHAGRSRSRCPACGELLRTTQNGKPDAETPSPPPGKPGRPRKAPAEDKRASGPAAAQDAPTGKAGARKRKGRK